MRNALRSLLVAITFALVVNSTAAITLSSVDNFSSTSEGWQIGGAGTQPSFNSGAGFDSLSGYLTHFSDGGGSNGKWLMWSDQSDWQGDYTAVGVTNINFWAVNQSGTPLSMRIAFNGPGGWFYSTGQTITTGANWTKLDYTLSSPNFTYAAGSGGSGVFADTLAGVTRFEIFGGASGVNTHVAILDAGTSVNTVGIDQITAVPEPSSFGLLLGGSLLWLLRRRS